MVSPRLHRLLVLLLLGIALGWPLLGSVPSVSGERAHAISAGETGGCRPDCGGCDGGSGGGQTCPTTVCPVIPAVVPLLELEAPPAVQAGRHGFVQERGRGRVPDVQLPPPRPILLA